MFLKSKKKKTFNAETIWPTKFWIRDSDPTFICA